MWDHRWGSADTWLISNLQVCGGVVGFNGVRSCATRYEKRKTETNKRKKKERENEIFIFFYNLLHYPFKHILNFL